MNAPLLSLLDVAEIIERIEQIARTHGLTMSQKTTLSTCRGSIHYHLKCGSQRGVLEITYWPAKSRLWLDIHDNRQAEWNLGLIDPIARQLAAQFQGTAVRRTTGS